MPGHRQFQAQNPLGMGVLAKFSEELFVGSWPTSRQARPPVNTSGAGVSRRSLRDLLNHRPQGPPPQPPPKAEPAAEGAHPPPRRRCQETARAGNRADSETDRAQTPCKRASSTTAKRTPCRGKQNGPGPKSGAVQ